MALVHSSSSSSLSSSDTTPSPLLLSNISPGPSSRTHTHTPPRLFPLLEELDALIISEQGNDFIADIDDSFKLQLTTKLEHQSSISSCLDESHGSKLLGSLYLFLLKCFPVKLSSNFRLSSRISLAQLLSAELCKRLQVSSINLYYFSRCL